MSKSNRNQKASRQIINVIVLTLSLQSIISFAAQPAGFEGTAYLKTQVTTLISGKNYGLNRFAFQGLIDQCNGFRQLYYKLPPLSPPDNQLEKLDQRIEEKYFDSNKARTTITSNYLEFTETQRWEIELKSNVQAGITTYPQTPPDCSLVKPVQNQSTTLWRDGRRYDLRSKTLKAIGINLPADKTPLASQTDFLASTSQSFLGQTCHEVTGKNSILISGGKSCIWDRFPFQKYLNWPYALSGQINIMNQVETIKPLEIKTNQAIPASMFDIPAGYKVIEQ